MRGRRAALGKRMTDHYAHFVRHGTPGPGWPAYRGDDRQVRIFDLADRMEVDPDAARYAAWGGRDVVPGID